MAAETKFEEDLARVANLSADEFVQALDATMRETITGDYWTQSLVGALETQRARATAALAFRAAQIVLGARALFSDQLIQNLVDPPAPAGRAASEAHHLFPVAYLHGRGIKDRRRVNQVANIAILGWHENNGIGGQAPASYVPRIRRKLGIDDDQWGRQCAEHALPPDWHAMEYETFLSERRRRMAEVIRVAFRKLGGESDAPPIVPPWFLPGAEIVWRRIADTERALRGVVRDVYGTVHGDGAARRMEESLSEPERKSLERALRARPIGGDPLGVVEYLYLAQLPPLLFKSEVWSSARLRFGGASDAKQKLQEAITIITPVRNEIAHVREVSPERLQRANLACSDVLSMLQANAS